MLIIPALGEAEAGWLQARAQPTQLRGTGLKTKRIKMAGVVAQLKAPGFIP